MKYFILILPILVLIGCDNDSSSTSPTTGNTGENGGETTEEDASGFWEKQGEPTDYKKYMKINNDGSGYECVFDQKSGGSFEANSCLDEYEEGYNCSVEISNDGQTLTHTSEDNEGIDIDYYNRITETDYPSCCTIQETNGEDSCPIQYNNGTIECNETDDCPNGQVCNSDNICE
tara:strand:+ start:74 stop:598 length:525 start_codon:yes stop_codon:yes gene_type:complete